MGPTRAKQGSRWTRHAILAAVLGATTVSLLTPSSGFAARSEFFGIVQGQFNAEGQLNDSDLASMAANGVRTNRFELGWRTVQPRRNAFNWGRSDQFIGAMASHGIRAVPFIWGTPEWVARNPGRPPVNSPSSEQAWRAFLKATVDRYGPGGSYWSDGYRDRYGPGATPMPIQAWQIWNEPNLKKFFNPGGTDQQSVQKYARLLRVAHDAIETRDPQARIVLAGNPGYPPSGGMKAWEFLSALYRVPDIKDYFDAAALHPYASDLNHVGLEIQKVHDVMRNNGDADTPLWLTELGWGSAPRDRFGINQGVEGQKRLLEGAYRLILSHRRAWNVQRLFWFLWRDPAPGSKFAHRCSFCGSAGLLRYGRSPKPAFAKFKGFSMETKRPQMTITSGPANGSVVKNPRPIFRFRSNEAGVTFECHVGPAPFATCNPPHQPPQLSDGRHTLFAKAVDAPGNESQVRMRSFTVDTNPPGVTISSGPADGSSSKNSSPSFGFSTGDSGATLACQLDGNGFHPCNSPFNASGLADGSHTFQVRATDRAGNQASKASTWTIDTVAPTVSITSGPNEGSVSNDPSPSFDFSSNEAGAELECRLDLRQFAPCDSPYATRQLRDGAHAFRVRATDRAGNVSAVALRSWTVDAPAILVSITSGPEPRSLIRNRTPRFAFSSSSSAAVFRCRLDGEAFRDCATPYTTPRLGQGDHRLQVRAVDGGRQSAVASRAFTVDTVAPSVRITAGPRNGESLTDHRPSFRFHSTEQGSKFRCAVNSFGFHPCRSPHDTRRLRNGLHRFRVLAIDEAGNRGEPRLVRFKVDTVEPKLRIKGPSRKRTTRNEASVAFKLRASERVGLECRIGRGGYRQCSRRFRTPMLGHGPHSLTVKAEDRAGNVSTRRKRFKIVQKRGGPHAHKSAPPHHG